MDLLPTDDTPSSGLSEVLQGLSRVLSPEGLSLSVERDLRQAEAALRLQQATWLRWETLWRAIQELLHDPNCLEPSVQRELEEALSLAELRGGPPALASLLPPAQDPTHLRARLLPALERRLGEKVAELAKYHGEGVPPCPPGKEGTPPTPLPDPPSSPVLGVAEALAAERRRLEDARVRQRELEQLLAAQREAYPQALCRVRALLETLGRCTWALAELDERQGEYLRVKGEAILLRARLEELTVLRDTYPPLKVKAHQHIRAGLEAAVAAAEAELEEGRAKRAAFRALGPEFAAMAAEYRELRQRLCQRRWALRQLQVGPAPPSPGSPP